MIEEQQQPEEDYLDHQLQMKEDLLTLLDEAYGHQPEKEEEEEEEEPQAEAAPSPSSADSAP